MRSRWVTALVAVGLVAAVGLGALVVWQPWRGEPEWLFTYAADSAAFEDQGSGVYRVRFSGGDGHLLAFTDRPDRDVTRVDLDAMASMWSSAFVSSNPNAVLVEQLPDSEQDSVVVEVLDFTVEDSQLQMDVQVLADDRADHGLSIARGAWVEVPKSVGPIRLFIDSGSWDPQPGCQLPFTPYWPPGQPPPVC
ncbi:MAG TPA: hypothetical protein VGP37_06975 [Candidatus Nanopelagicales bacterium]|nr:hypothetical protein [Candidatus Nanopelagicales bacterium]